MTPKERAAMQQALDALEAVSTAKKRGFGIGQHDRITDEQIAGAKAFYEAHVVCSEAAGGEA